MPSKYLPRWPGLIDFPLMLRRSLGLCLGLSGASGAQPLYRGTAAMLFRQLTDSPLQNSSAVPSKRNRFSRRRNRALRLLELPETTARFNDSRSTGSRPVSRVVANSVANTTLGPDARSQPRKVGSLRALRQLETTQRSSLVLRDSLGSHHTHLRITQRRPRLRPAKESP